MAADERAAQPGPPAQPYGEVFDRGYQHYTGPRLGRSYAIRRLVIYSIRRGLGIKKRWTAKILPFLMYIIAYLPAIVIIGILAFVPLDDLDGLGFDSLYGVLELIILIYAAALAPEMLCDDRRENTLHLYFARPLTRLNYLSAKVIAMSILMATIVFGPPLLLHLGITLVDDSPVSYFVNNLQDLLKIAVYGVLLSAFFAAISLIVATFTTRKGIASAIVIIGVIILTSISNAFYETLNNDTWRGYLVFLSPFDYIDALRRWVFLEDTQNQMVMTSDVPGALIGLWVLVVVAVAVFVMQRAYLSEE
jgi:ABC-2 type transport system permease protein